MKEKLFNIAWFSPVKEGCTSWYLTKKLLPYLKDYFSIELFTDTLSSGVQETLAVKVNHYLSFFQKEKHFHTALYFLDTTPFSSFVRYHLGLSPGVVIFESLWSDAKSPDPLIESPWKDFIKKLYNFNHLIPKKPPYFWDDKNLLLEREISLACLPIFISARDTEEFQREVKLSVQGKSPKAFYLPCPVDFFCKEDDPFALSTLTIASAALPTLEGRAHKWVKALARAAKKGVKAKLFWAVEEELLSAALEQLKDAGFNLAKNKAVLEKIEVKLISSLSPRLWQSIVKDAHIAIHTYSGVVGKLYPYLTISLAAGSYVVVSRFSESFWLPDEAVYKVKLGAGEEEEFFKLFLFFADNAQNLKRNKTALDYAKLFHSSEEKAFELKEILLSNFELLMDIKKRWLRVRELAFNELVASFSSSFDALEKSLLEKINLREILEEITA
ncbi:MAG: hypothetical protein D6780_05785 [Candidatus Dadabacteria bacterium]|nr:MAG: hypothetical protein D6780_05785 [Candidatus Dadabacteria bacterium]